MFIKNFFIRTTDRLCCIFAALSFSQIPNFIHQYQIRLAGHVEELDYQLGEIHKIALKAHLSLDQYIQKFLSHTDLDFHSQGIYLQNIQNRYESLSSQLTHLKQCSMVFKPIYLLLHLNLSIAWSTLKEFTTSIPINLEGFYYILMGLFFGAGIFWFLRRIVAKLKFNKDSRHELKPR